MLVLYKPEDRCLGIHEQTNHILLELAEMYVPVMYLKSNYLKIIRLHRTTTKEILICCVIE